MAVYSIVSRSGLGISSSLGASSTATISLFPSPTSTGVPNCYDRSPFDGTVNGGYLILCDTDLPGYDLAPYDGSDIADCISACSSYVPTGAGQCVAVEFDTQATYNACKLKSNISIINRGDNQFAQAAILVNEPYAPTIQFVDQNNPASSTGMSLSTAAMSSMAGSSNLQSSIVQVQSSSIQVGVTSSSPVISSTPPILSTPSILPSSSSSSNVIVSSSALQPSASPLITSSSTSTPVSSTVASSSSTSSVTGCLPQPTTTLCPAFSGETVNQGGFCYNIACSATLQGNILTGNSTIAASLSNCHGFCNLLNLALPFACIGVNFLDNFQLGQDNCFLLSSITGLVYTPGTDSGALIYAGYTAHSISGLPTSSSSSSSIASSTAASSSSSAVSSSVTKSSSVISSSPIPSSSSASSSASLVITSSSSSLAVSRTSSSSSSSSTYVAPTCAASYAPGPTMGSLCTNPSYSGQGLSYDSYGNTENYEVECGTVFTGTALAPVVAFDLPDCIKACQYDNIYTAASCKAVIFNNTAAASPPINNCFPFASLNGLTRGSTVFDGARLLYSGYPCIIDYNTGYTFS